MKIVGRLLVLMLSISCFFIIASESQMNKSNIIEYQKKFQDVLLIINFNHPHYDNIPFLKELYGQFFSRIVFYGEQDHPEVTALKIDKGFLLAPVIHDVLTKYPDYKGYIFLQDDCVLNVWNCMSLDLNKLWLPHATLTPSNWEYMWYQRANMVDAHDPNSWKFWTVSWGYKAMKEGWLQLSVSDHENLNKNAGLNNVPGAQCDMFYIPQRFANDIIRLNSYFNNAFCEFAVPTMISCLDLQENWERTSLYWNYYQGTNWPMESTTVHPVKFSNSQLRAIIQEIFNRIIN